MPLFLDDAFVGSASLLRDADTFFLLTARHVLINEATEERYAGTLTFAPPHASGSTHPFALDVSFIGTLPGTDAAVVPIVEVEAGGLAHLETACTPRDLLCCAPGEIAVSRSEVFIVGFPGDLCYFEDVTKYLGPLLYASHLPPADFQAKYPEFLTWIPPTDVWDLATAKNTTLPNLKGASGGPWLVVDRSSGRPEVKILATHRRRIPEPREDGLHYIACGCPIDHHATLIASASAPHAFVRT